MNNYYDVLEVAKNASQTEIKKAFKKKAKQYHPDISKEEKAEEKFKEVQEAYAVLGDETKKEQYDQYGHEAFNQQQGNAGSASYNSSDFDFGDIFGDLFGRGGGFGGFNQQRQQRQGGPKNGQDVEMEMTISFKDAVFGAKKKVDLKIEEDCHTCHGKGAEKDQDISVCKQCDGSGVVYQQTQTIFGAAMTEQHCPNCSGKGKEIKNPCNECMGKGRNNYKKDITISIPAGVDEGSHLRVSDKGIGGHLGGRNGDLFLILHVQKDKNFIREGKNILVTIPINYTQAVLGDKINIPTIHGEVKMKIPKGTQPNTKLRIKGKGVNPKSGSDGDQIVTIKIVIPTKLNKEEEKIIDKLSEIEQDHAHQKTFFKGIKDIFR